MIQLKQRFCVSREIESLFCGYASVLSKSQAKFRVGQKSQDRLSQFSWIAGVHRQTIMVLAYYLGGPEYVRGYDRDTTSHRLNQ
jgi:hypothetical protein